ncbi:MAG: hypothetical protein HY902_10760 [Deltaproteobacteria bacterium]|nr:hypothetical protein [Deltaproteobacteria bacterium]
MGLLATACLPVAELQSARLAGPGVVEVTPGYAASRYTNYGRSASYAHHGALLVATGLTRTVDLRLHAEYVRSPRYVIDGDTVKIDYLAVGLGPKFSCIPGRLAIYVPLGFGIGGSLNALSWQLHPTLIGTLPLSAGVEVNASAKLLIWLDGRDGVAGVSGMANLGLGMSSDLARWAIRPEIGVSNLDSHVALHGALGVTYYFGAKR